MTNHREIPDWVNWIAQDSDGSWWGYEVEPLQYHAGWYENELGRRVRLQRDEFNPDWQSTLQRITA
ncbi:MAG: hypothetical protein OEZ39_04155 [Gammaproteobacteria bacterium]|nr:hypothetical protein [Gammaproteobacteria bacterium]MDH5651051.1 hypothetical protein [Gammaproteobacteria bacterium]